MQNIDPKNMINSQAELKIELARLPKETVGTVKQAKRAARAALRISNATAERAARLQYSDSASPKEFAAALDEMETTFSAFLDAELNLTALLLKEGRPLEGRSLIEVVA
ncbi:hypothetical protein [Leucobacter chromiireducens]|uniref:hypothetical protein n=1 Tax=Leucobacter chromiireducens TaxID=283877 RepID=UPI000F63DA56|nr:hypothetical protein [Leucobacter chromiireducens]